MWFIGEPHTLTCEKKWFIKVHLGAIIFSLSVLMKPYGIVDSHTCIIHLLYIFHLESYNFYTSTTDLCSCTNLPASLEDHDDDSEMLSNDIDIVTSHPLSHFQILLIWDTDATSLYDKQEPSQSSQACSPHFSISVLIGTVWSEQNSCQSLSLFYS